MDSGGVKLRFLLSALIAVVLCSNAVAATYYVSSTGNDSLGNGSTSLPWKTLNATAHKINPGDNVIACGTFANDYFFWSQPVGSPVVTLSACASGATITGDGQWAVMVFAYGPMIIDGLRLQASAQVAVPIDVATKGGVTIRNVAITSAPSASSGIRILSSSNVSITNTSISSIGDPNGQGSGDCIVVLGSTAVDIEHNSFGSCGHSAVDVIDDSEGHYSSGVVVRSNQVANTWGGGIYIARLSTNVLVDSNTIIHCGDGVLTYGKVGLQLAANNNIIRRNIITLTGANNPLAATLNDTGMILEAYNFSGYGQNAMHNRIYNNAFYKNATTPIYVGQKDSFVVTDNKFANNILYYNRLQGPQEPYWPSGDYQVGFELYHADPTNKWLSFPNANYFTRNIILHADAQGDHPGDASTWYYDGGGNAALAWSKSLSQVQQSYPGYITDNLELNPGFSNADAGLFDLLATSPAVDSGAHLSRTTSSGNGTAVPVDDDLFFFDGGGMLPGDSVQVGGNQPVAIVSIDRVNHVLKLASPVTFSVGMPVDLPFNGNGPDIGPIESSVAAPVVVAVTPSSATMTTSQQQQFSAVVLHTSNTAVNWTVVGPGSITSTGLYTAPSSLTSAQTATITATSTAVPGARTSVTVTLNTPVTINLTTSAVTVPAGQTQQMTAVVSGSANTAVTWAISPSLGSISASGLYSAPATVASTQTVTVTARSVADASKYATSIVTLVRATVYYVSDTGSDVTGTGSQSSPWRTLAAAERKVQPGDTLTACGSFVDDYFYWSQGAQAAPLTLAACPTGATVSGAGQWGSMLFAYGPMVVRGLQFANVGPHVTVPLLISSSNVSIQGVIINYAPNAGTGIRITGTQNASVTGSTIVGVGVAGSGSDCISVATSANITISQNSIGACSRYAIEVLSSAAGTVAGSGIIVSGNTIHNTTGGGIYVAPGSSGVTNTGNVSN
jgi:hypothetical protein